MKHLFTLLFIFTLLNLKSQISITSSSFTYLEDFDGLASSPTGGTSSVLPTGWSFIETGTGSNSTYVIDNTNTGGMHSFGNILDPERALGEFTSNNISSVFGVYFQNNTGVELKSISLSYDGEVWFNGTATGDKLDFQYQIGVTTVNASGTWIDVNALDFNSTDIIGSTTINATISGLSIINGQNIVFRWVSTNPTNTDDGLGIDNFQITSIVLPVEFSYFNSSNKKGTSYLSFSTASETNNDYFTIERSADGRSFDAIGEIKGAGNSNTSLTYEYTDEKPYVGINFYCIKQTDYDGKYSYSDIKSVRHNTIGALNITPRTTEGRLQVTTDIEAYSLDVYNVAGQQVKSFKSLSQDQYIYIDDLTAGLYFIRINHSDQVETTKIVKI